MFRSVVRALILGAAPLALELPRGTFSSLVNARGARRARSAAALGPPALWPTHGPGAWCWSGLRDKVWKAYFISVEKKSNERGNCMSGDLKCMFRSGTRRRDLLYITSRSRLVSSLWGHMTGVRGAVALETWSLGSAHGTTAHDSTASTTKPPRPRRRGCVTRHASPPPPCSSPMPAARSCPRASPSSRSSSLALAAWAHSTSSA